MDGRKIVTMTQPTHPPEPGSVEEIRRSFQYCSQETIEAIIRYRSEADPALVPKIVFGIIARETPAKSAEALKTATDESRFLEDLGIDSLAMLEIVLGIEEALNVKIEDSELRGIQTIGDVNRFLAEKIASSPARPAPETRVNPPAKFSNEDVLALLPQQPPFLFIDEAVREGDAIVAAYLVRGDEDCLRGHFKGNPIFPASLVFEAMGQAGCLWLMVSGATGGECQPPGEIVFASLEGAHFHRKVRPGDRLEIRATLTRLRPPAAIFRGEVFCGGELVATVGRLMLAFGELPAEEAGEIPAL